MRAYNKGEWSELYAICLILSDKIIKVADDNLEPTDRYIKVLQLLMKSIAGEARYDTTSDDVAVVVDGKVIKRLLISKPDIEKLLDGITTGSGRSFSVAVGDKIMSDLMLDSFKATSYQKSDLNTMSIMPTEETPREVGFSIKSQIGGLSTLLNASRSTNFIYEVVNFEGDIEAINNLTNPAQVMKRIQAVKSAGGSFVYKDTYSQSFKQNLRLTDSLLPETLAYMVLDYFSTTRISKISDIAERITPNLPFETTELEVSTKIKAFLSNIALGMVPTVAWDGSAIGGGCIFIRHDGNLVCFTLYDMDRFNNYLFNNTKFDTASTTRHKFGKIYRGEGGRLYFELNTDIRLLH